MCKAIEDMKDDARNEGRMCKLMYIDSAIIEPKKKR